jgi:hypothetical protein
LFEPGNVEPELLFELSDDDKLKLELLKLRDEESELLVKRPDENRLELKRLELGNVEPETLNTELLKKFVLIGTVLSIKEFLLLFPRLTITRKN